MTEKTKRQRSKNESQIIGFRLPKPLAARIKEEAARRNMRLNKLLEEMWNNYEKNKKR
jgi:hypothetical protein